MCRSRSTIQKRLALIQEDVTTLQPDIVGLQEVDRFSFRSRFVDQAQSFMAMYPYYHWATTWRHPWVPFPYSWNPCHHFGMVWAGQLILSRYPIESASTVSLGKREDQSWVINSFSLDRVFQTITLRLGETLMTVIHTHLEAFHPPTRRRQIHAIIQSIPPHQRCMILGDLNALPVTLGTERYFDDEPNINYGNDPTIELLRHRGFEFGIEHCDFPAQAPTRQLSYIGIMGGRIQTMGCLPNRDCSDHLALWADVECV